MISLKDDVLLPVAARVREQASSLRSIRRFQRCGVEGWLKVEAVCALSELVEGVRNTGPDLLLSDGTSIELKAATDFNTTAMRNACIKYGCPCLFLADGTEPQRIYDIEDTRVYVVGYESISDGSNEWILGLVAPRSQMHPGNK